MRLDAGTTKNEEGRVFAYGLVDELKRLIDGQRTSAKGLREKNRLVPWVFHRPGGDAVKSFRFAWKEACRQAGCQGGCFTTSGGRPCGISLGPECRSA